MAAHLIETGRGKWPDYFQYKKPVEQVEQELSVAYVYRAKQDIKLDAGSVPGSLWQSFRYNPKIGQRRWTTPKLLGMHATQP